VLLGTAFAVLLKVNVINRMREKHFIIYDCTNWTFVTISELIQDILCEHA